MQKEKKLEEDCGHEASIVDDNAKFDIWAIAVCILNSVSKSDLSLSSLWVEVIAAPREEVELVIDIENTPVVPEIMAHLD